MKSSYKSKSSILLHIVPILFVLVIAVSPQIITNGKTSNAKTYNHYMIKNATRSVGITSRGRIKKYKVSKTGTNASIKVDKYFGRYDIKSKNTYGKTTFKIRYTLKGSKKWHTILAKVKVMSKKKYAKHTFKKQNRFRKQHKKKKLAWSDVAYRFAQFRLKTSGFDRHQNLQRDARLFFGNYYYSGQIKVGENLIWSSITHSPYRAIEFWKGSKRHRTNMLRKQYRCGAMALTKTTWCAVFFENSPKKLKKWYNNNSNK